MRVLVTGGSGFIGSHVVDALACDGHEVVSVDRVPSPHRSPAATYVAGDLRDRDTCELAVRGVDAVSHQAGRVGIGRAFGEVTDYVADNDAGTAELLRALAARRFGGRLVLASSMVVYGEGTYRCSACGRVRPGPRPEERLARGRFEPVCPACGADLEPEATAEDAPLAPQSVYAATKVHQEHLCASFGREAGCPVAALRYHNVYGPRCPEQTPYCGVASLFVGTLRAGRSPRVFEDGAQRRDFVHVSDVARANVVALNAPVGTVGAFNVASGRPVTVHEMAAALAIAFGGPAPEVTGEWRVGDVRHVYASPARAASVLGFEAAVDLDEGAPDLVASYQ